MGTYNSELVSSQYNSIQIKDKLYLFNQILLEIDFEKNTVKKYDFSNHIVPKAMLVKNDTVLLSFNHVPLGLTTHNKSITQFEVAGTDQKFHPAVAVSVACLLANLTLVYCRQYVVPAGL